MRGLGRAAVLLGLVVGTGYLAYTFVLSDRARQDLRDAARVVRDSYEKVAVAVEGLHGQAVSDDQPLPNQQATEAQWEALGY